MTTVRSRFVTSGTTHYATGTEHIASITISSDVDFAIGEFGVNSQGSYVALGDSYSSGEGRAEGVHRAEAEG